MPEFDENGNTIEEEINNLSEELDPGEEVIEETEVEAGEGGENEPEAEAGAGEKYRIGDKSFTTLEEARAYADQMLAEDPAGDSAFNAYRQGILDAQTAQHSATNVTPENDDDFDEDQYFANPKEFLKQFATKIRSEATQEINQNLSVREQSEKIWRDFTERHPKLEGFRAEVEDFVAKNQDVVKKIIRSKGTAEGYDWVALKLTDQFSRYANALKPRRTLRNTSTLTTPSGGGHKSVTPGKGVKKPMTMAEQIRSIRVKR